MVETSGRHIVSQRTYITGGCQPISTRSVPLSISYHWIVQTDCHRGTGTTCQKKQASLETSRYQRRQKGHGGKHSHESSLVFGKKSCPRIVTASEENSASSCVGHGRCEAPVVEVVDLEDTGLEPLAVTIVASYVPALMVMPTAKSTAHVI